MKPAAPRGEDCALDVFAKDKDVHRPFETVCVLDSKTASNLFSDKTVAGAIENAKPDACECGADALIIDGGRAEGPSFGSYGTGFSMLRAIRYVR